MQNGAAEPSLLFKLIFLSMARDMQVANCEVRDPTCVKNALRRAIARPHGAVSLWM